MKNDKSDHLISRRNALKSSAATENFLARECHALDVPWRDKPVESVDEPIVNKGWTKVPDKPGLGVTLNEEEVRRHLKPGTGFIEPQPNGTTSTPGIAPGAKPHC